MNVGKVTGTERGKGTLAVIKMELDDSALPLHRDATLKVRPRTFLEGGMFVDLHPGTPGSSTLDDGGTIPVSATATPVLLGHATADLRSATRDNLRYLFHAARQSLEGDAPQALHDAQPHVGPVVPRDRRGRARPRRVRSRATSRAPFARPSTTMAALASRDEQLADLLTGLNRTARALGNRRAEVGRSLEELDPLLAETRPALAELNRLFPSARAFAAELRPGIRRAPETLRLAAAVPRPGRGHPAAERAAGPARGARPGDALPGQPGAAARARR